MTTALVPYGEEARHVRRAIWALPYRVHMRWLTEAARGMAYFAEECRRVGLIPPDARTLRHGTVWTSPEGHQLRVRGRRGRPATFHWGRP